MVESNRQTGRTTRMLLKLATHISDTWDKESKVVVVAYNERYADVLQRKLINILGEPKKQQRGLIQYGSVVIIFAGRSRANHLAFRVCRDAYHFYDHYQG